MTRTSNNNEFRLHSLDWLRVIAIAVLVIYHTCMVYVPEWGYHYKNPLASESIQSFMILTSPWRMGLLWIVSGIALGFMLKGRQLLPLLQIRSNQLLLPLLIGVVFVVPVQLFAQMKQAGDMPLDIVGFVWAFYVQPSQYFDNYSSGIWPRFDVNHLWFLRSLWRFSILLLIVSPVLKLALFNRVFVWLSARLPAVLCVFFVPVLLVEWLAEGESVREYYGFSLLFTGFVLGIQNQFWQTLLRHVKLLSWLALVAMLGLQIGFVTIWQSGLHEHNLVLSTLIGILYIINKILPVLAILALAQRFLNKENDLIKQLNPFVFPLYILHQSVIIGFAYAASNSQIYLLSPPHYQLPLNLLFTCLSCYLLLYIIAKVNVLRVCFGMRLKGGVDAYKSPVIRNVVFLLCLPLMFELVF